MHVGLLSNVAIETRLKLCDTQCYIGNQVEEKEDIM